ncbi:hypothetical protein SAMN05216312_102230 [Cohnella sp. OV330]|uniref:hypothetical protein n=1 Tax=Cohnella sp. OV330 TaxID=1855288 RepID=UPI0008F291F1|nr:hypothetical protein [Cohnella sp. OV330]SFA91785.1 hypothetical protein SAMN05216312_102230 [Cohnella sp. OV330]
MPIIYVGPNIGGLNSNAVFSGEIPSSLAPLLTKYPQIELLLVQIEDAAAAYIAISTPGTPEHEAYRSLGGSAPGNEQPSTTPPPTVDPLSKAVPSRQRRTNGTYVNAADGYNDDGSLNVRVLNGSSDTGVIDVTLQNDVSAIGNGTPFTATAGNATLRFTIRGTSTSRTVLFELADESGVYITCTAFGVTDPTKMASQSSGGSNSAPESWTVDVPAGCSFRARSTALVGGTLAIKGKAVIR